MLRMTTSILLTVKKMLGIAEEYHAFDLDIITDINSVFLTLYQLGIGPSTPFQIYGDDENWTDFMDPEECPGIQTYVVKKVRLLFDPPTSSFHITAIENQCAEFEWRMMTQADWNKNKDRIPPTEEPEEPSVPTEPDETEPPDSEGEAIRQLLGKDVYERRVIRRK